MSITITEKASKQLHTLLKENNNPNAKVLVGVRPGGCSGMSYSIDLIENIDKKTVSVKTGSIEVLLLEDHLPYLQGIVLDYNDGLLNSGFKFSNPNARQSCGCGSSFSV